MPRKRTGPPYRRIVITFWNDPEVKGNGDDLPGLELEEKAVLAYLVTNEHSHACGVYRLPPAYVLEELGVDRKRLRKLFKGPLAPFATYDWETLEVFVHNMARHQIDGGLHGKDRRIKWVENHLALIQSASLLQEFRAKYPTWSLDYSAILPDGETPGQLTIENANADAKREGVSHGPSPSTKTGEKRTRNTATKTRKKRTAKPPEKAKRQAKREGASDARPSSQFTEETIQPPVLPANAAKGREGVDRGGEEQQQHPALGALWPEVERLLYSPWWHGGNGPVILEGGKSVALGLERLLLNDLLHATGNAELVLWGIANAARLFGWSGDERHTLYWLKEPENLSNAEGQYHKAEPVTGTDALAARPMPAAGDGDGYNARQAELRAQLDMVRRAGSLDAAEPDDPLTARDPA